MKSLKKSLAEAKDFFLVYNVIPNLMGNLSWLSKLFKKQFLKTSEGSIEIPDQVRETVNL